jgi:hypothetical protein
MNGGQRRAAAKRPCLSRKLIAVETLDFLTLCGHPRLTRFFCPGYSVVRRLPIMLSMLSAVLAFFVSLFQSRASLGMANVKTRWLKPHDFHPLWMGTRTKRCRCSRSSHGTSPIFPHTAALGTSLGVRPLCRRSFSLVDKGMLATVVGALSLLFLCPSPVLYAKIRALTWQEDVVDRTPASFSASATPMGCRRSRPLTHIWSNHQRGGPDHESASRSAFASCKSAVSKPSVNQP